MDPKAKKMLGIVYEVTQGGKRGYFADPSEETLVAAMERANLDPDEAFTLLIGLWEDGFLERQADEMFVLSSTGLAAAKGGP